MRDTEGYVKALEHAYVQSVTLYNGLYRSRGAMTVNVTKEDQENAEARLEGLREAFATPESTREHRGGRVTEKAEVRP